jgi:excinuclease ABC subunit C
MSLPPRLPLDPPNAPPQDNSPQDKPPQDKPELDAPDLALAGDPSENCDIEPDDLEPENIEPEDLEAESAFVLNLDDEAGAASLRRGLRAVRAHWKHAPPGPGVYRMLAEDGAVLYVGKAKSLRRRVASYTRLTGHANR